MTLTLTGKNAVVTGANRGIGLAIADALLKHGIEKVYAAVRNPDSLAALQAQYPDRVIPIKTDLTDQASLTALAEQAKDADIVINNSGVLTLSRPLSEDAIENLAYEMDVNVYGLLRIAQAFAPVLKQRAGSVFAQLNSVASIKNFLDLSTYSASKAAAFSITQGLRDEFLENGVRMISVHPGPITTDMAKQAGMDEMGEPPEVVAEGLIQAILSDDGYLVFPDSMAKEFENAYQGYADALITPVENAEA